MSLTSATEVNPVIINSIRENLKEYVGKITLFLLFYFIVLNYQKKKKKKSENGEGVLHEKFHDFLVNQSATAKFVNILKCLSLDILSPVINSIHAKVYDKYSFFFFLKKKKIKIKIKNIISSL